MKNDKFIWLLISRSKKIYCIKKQVMNIKCEKIKFKTQQELDEYIISFLNSEYVEIDDFNEFKKLISIKSDSYLDNFDLHITILNEEKSKMKDLPDDEAIAYIDGSISRDKKKCGSGVLMITNKKTEKIISTTEKKSYLSLDSSAAEILSVIIAVNTAIEKNIKKIVIYYDCNTVVQMLEERKKPVKSFYKLYKRYIDWAKQNISIEFVKVKAHSNNLGNLFADGLARTATKIT